MIIAIKDEADLYLQEVAFDCLGKSLVGLLKVMQAFYTTDPNHEESLEVQINPGLTTDGYVANPSMLARNAHTGIFSYYKGMVREGQLVLLFTNDSSSGVPFITRLKDFLKGEGADGIATLQIPFDDVPETYRYKPEQLRYHIKRMMNIKLVTRKSKSFWTYRRGK